MLLNISKIIYHLSNIKLKFLHKPPKNQVIFVTPGTSQLIAVVCCRCVQLPLLHGRWYTGQCSPREMLLIHVSKSNSLS